MDLSVKFVFIFKGF